MLRSVTKTCFAYAYSGAAAVRQLFHAAGQKRPSMPFVVCYHRVVERFDDSSRRSIPSMLISTAMLERHIDWMARRYTLISLDELGSHLESPRQFRKPPAAITFDDGYRDVYYNAMPLLRRKGVPAAVFTVTGLVDNALPQIFDRLYLALHDLHSQGLSMIRTVSGVSRSMKIDTEVLDRLKNCTDEPFHIMRLLLNAVPREQMERIVAELENGTSHSADLLEEIKPLTWEMLNAMSSDGMTIGSHTRSHALLTSESMDAVHKELRESRQILETNLQKPVCHFAYPDGRFSPAVVEAVSMAGYRYAYGICRGRDQRFPLLTIPRKVLWERSSLNALGRFSPAVMNCHANWVFGRRTCFEHNHHSIQEAGTYAKIS